MKLFVGSVSVGLVSAVVVVLLWNGFVVRGNDDDAAVADQEITRVIAYVHHPALGEGEHPAVWLDDHPIVALVTIEAVGNASWNTASGTFEGPALGALIYTPVKVRVEEYIKGSGHEELDVGVRGGVADGITMDLEVALQQGSQAVLFISKPSSSPQTLIVNNAYILDGDTAYSDIDKKTIAVDDLLSGLRDAAPAKTSD